MMMANLTYIIVTTAHPVRRSLVFTRCRAQNRYIYMVVWCCFLHKTDRQSEEQGGGGVCGLSIRLEGPHSVGPTVARKKVRRQEQINRPF